MRNFMVLLSLFVGIGVLATCSDESSERAPQLNSNHPGWGQATCFGSGCHIQSTDDYPHGDQYTEADCADCHGDNWQNNPPTTGTLTGRVHQGPTQANNFESGVTVTAINIMNPGLQYSSQPSGADGSFSLEVPPGTYDFQLKKLNLIIDSFQEDMPSLTIGAGQTINCTQCHTPTGDALGYLYLTVN